MRDLEVEGWREGVGWVVRVELAGRECRSRGVLLRCACAGFLGWAKAEGRDFRDGFFLGGEVAGVVGGATDERAGRWTFC